MNERYQAIVQATRRLLMSEGINPDDAPNDVWAAACQRVEVDFPAQPVHPLEGPEPRHDAQVGKPIDLGTHL